MFNFWDTPEGRQMMGLPPVPPPLYKPSYQPAAGLTVSDPTGTNPLNQQYFVTQKTANYLAVMFGATVTTQAPGGAGGPVTVPDGLAEYWLNWTDTSDTFNPVAYKLNAGALAYYFCPANGPDGTGVGVPNQATVSNPDIAVQLCNERITEAHLAAMAG